MALHQVCKEWEYNGRDDSDFYIVAYNDVTDLLERIEVGSTRYASGRGYTDITPMASVTAEIWTKAETALFNITALRLVGMDERDRKADACRVGTKVVLTKEVNNRPRASTTTEENCWKCSGQGKWVNPRNPKDERTCFGCKGTGKRTSTSSKATKGAMVSFPVGTKAEVVRIFENRSKYGTYDYGSTVVCRTAEGTEFRAKAEALIADRPALTSDQIALMAEHIAARRDFYSPFATSSLSLVGRSGIVAFAG